MDDISSLLRDSATSFLADRYALARLKGRIGQPQQVDRASWREMGELGWLGLGLSESHGGIGMSLREAAVLSETFGRAAFSAPYVAASVMPAAMLSLADGEPARQLSTGLLSGESLLALAWQEQINEFEPDAPTSRLDGNRVSGSKCFVPAADSADFHLVSVRDGDELAIVAIAADAAGIERQDYAAGLGTASTLRFAQTPILHAAPLLRGARAHAALQMALDAGRIALAAELQGLAAGMLERTLDYVKHRVQFGRPIGSFQVIQHRCVDLHIAVQLAGASWRHALQRSEGSDAAKATAIHAAKARCADVAQKLGREAIQMHGAMGFTEEVDIGLYVRAALHGYAWLGTPVQHRRRLLALADAEVFHV